MSQISALLSSSDYGEGEFHGSAEHENIDKLVENIQRVLAEKDGHNKGDLESLAAVSLVEDCFDHHDRLYTKEQEERNFEITETFIFKEQRSSKMRREKARHQEAGEELRLAAEIAKLKGFRDSTKHIQVKVELQRKISDAERAYFSRRMVVSKASQMASADCRLQFARVRDFFEELHHIKKDALLREFQRAMRRLEVIHRLKQSDARVKALEVQIADRVYRKKVQDLNELHIAQNLEEAIYMESMLDLLDKVQAGKETAAKEVFELHVKNLRDRQESDTRRSQELTNLRADATVEIAKLVALYCEDKQENDEALQKREEEVEAMERRKSNVSQGKHPVSIGELYDTVLWPVVKNHCGLTSSDSDYSSDFTLEEEDICDDSPAESNEQEQEPSREEGGGCWYARSNNHDLSGGGGSVSDASVDESGASMESRDSNLSSAGNMHVKQLMKDLRERENSLIKQHKEEDRRERVENRNTVRALKRKHQMIIEGLIECCLVERQNLRERIDERMAALLRRQEATTEELRETVTRDAGIMQEALRAEDKRVEVAETESFSKAQTMISAQVFHEVRNALSSVVAMSEIACSMKKDSAVTADQLIASVDDMLDQIKEIVDYALKMLNNGKNEWWLKSVSAKSRAPHILFLSP